MKPASIGPASIKTIPLRGASGKLRSVAQHAGCCPQLVGLKTSESAWIVFSRNTMLVPIAFTLLLCLNLGQTLEKPEGGRDKSKLQIFQTSPRFLSYLETVFKEKNFRIFKQVPDCLDT